MPHGGSSRDRRRQRRWEEQEYPQLWAPPPGTYQAHITSVEFDGERAFCNFQIQAQQAQEQMGAFQDCWRQTTHLMGVDYTQHEDSIIWVPTTPNDQSIFQRIYFDESIPEGTYVSGPPVRWVYDETQSMEEWPEDIYERLTPDRVWFGEVEVQGVGEIQMRALTGAQAGEPVEVTLDFSQASVEPQTRPDTEIAYDPEWEYFCTYDNFEVESSTDVESIDTDPSGIQSLRRMEPVRARCRIRVGGPPEHQWSEWVEIAEFRIRQETIFERPVGFVDIQRTARQVMQDRLRQPAWRRHLDFVERYGMTGRRFGMAGRRFGGLYNTHSDPTIAEAHRVRQREDQRRVYESLAIDYGPPISDMMLNDLMGVGARQDSLRQREDEQLPLHNYVFDEETDQWVPAPSAPAVAPRGVLPEDVEELSGNYYMQGRRLEEQTDDSMTQRFEGEEEPFMLEDLLKNIGEALDE